MNAPKVYTSIVRDAVAATKKLSAPAPVRPCTARDPRWWDTGHEGNGYAAALCRRCPFRRACESDPAPAVGVVRAGVAYDDYGLPIDICACGRATRRVDSRTVKCGHCRTAKPSVIKVVNRPAMHHDRIHQMLTGPKPCGYAEVARAIGCTTTAVRGHWERWTKANGLPSVNPSKRRPTDGEVVDRWLALREAGLVGKEITDRLGISRDTLRVILDRAREAGDQRVPPPFKRRGARRAAA